MGRAMQPCCLWMSLGQSPTSFGSFSCLETTHGRYVLRWGCTQLASTAKTACIPHMAVVSGLFAKPTAFLTTFRKAPSCFAQQGKYLTISYLNILKCFAEIHFEWLQCLLVQVTKSAAALCKTTLLVGCSLRGRTRCPYSITYSDGMYFTLNVPSGKAQQSRLLNHEWRY